jgi:hypothetical protein
VVCREWNAVINACLSRLRLCDPPPEALSRIGGIFPRIFRLKLTAVRTSPRLLSLPGGMRRAQHLRLACKRPGGGRLAMGHLGFLRCAAQQLAVLSLSSCEITAWSGLEACAKLRDLRLVHCCFTPAAAEGMTRALVRLSSLLTLELRAASPAPPLSGPRTDAAAPAEGREAGLQAQGSGQLGDAAVAACSAASVWLPALLGLGAAASRLTALALSAPLPGEEWGRLVREELPRIQGLRSLDLQLTTARSDRALAGSDAEGAGGVGAGAAAGAAAAPPPATATRERDLSSLLPAVCAAAPQLTALVLRGHTTVSDGCAGLWAGPLDHPAQPSPVRAGWGP